MQTFSLPELPYGFDALEPHISKRIMELHYTKHHQGYVDKLNAALEGHDTLRRTPIEALLSSLQRLPDTLQTAVRNQGGGYYNHSQFWQWLSPTGGGQPTGTLGEALEKKYGSFQQFVDAFSTAATGVFGSGWAWLEQDLSISTTPNQDSPLTQGRPAPILGLDVWEHAYYLDYTSARADYIKAWWNIIDWQRVAQSYAEQAS